MVGGGVSATCYRPYQNCRDLSSFMKLNFIFRNIQLTCVYTHMQTHTEGERERDFSWIRQEKHSRDMRVKRTIRLLRGHLLAVSHTVHCLLDQKEKNSYNQFEVEMPPVKVNLC